MLCQFSVKNYRCFKDTVTLNMQAANISEFDDSVLIDVDGEKFLPLAAIYGPNAGGKSTVLLAMHSLISKVMMPICAVGCDNKDCLEKYNTEAQIVEPFAFSEASLKSPTEYEIFFRTLEYEYQYQLHVQNEKVIFESLWKKSLKGYRYSEIYTRTKNKIDRIKGSFKNYIVSDISSNLPLLSYFAITHKRNAIIKDIVNWLEDGVLFINYTDINFWKKIAISNDTKTKKHVLKLLESMDIKIKDYIIKEDKKGNIDEVYSIHTINSKDYRIDFREESDGTKKLFSLLHYVIDSLNTGATIISDELDAHLHPKLLENIISLYRNPKVNPKKAQLIFTSHDLATMSNKVFRRDEIWFVAQNNEQASTLYSLVEFKDNNGKSPRKDERYDKQYLEGRYGADPYVQKLVNWGDD